MTSPPARVSRAERTLASALFLRNFTEPSQKAKFARPGW